MSQQAFEMLESFVMDLMQQMKIPGVSIAILLNGKEAYAEGYGARDLEQNLPMTPDSLFGIGSISKSFGALAIMQLQEQNKLNINDPVNKYINFKLGKKDDPIRIHHLLSHTTGLPELWAGHSIVFRLTGGIDEMPPMSSWKDFLTYINGAQGEFCWNLGEKYSYNNDTYALIAPIVEKVTHMPYPEYVRTNILKPLKMNRTTYSKEEFEKDENSITGYINLDGKLTRNPIPINPLSYASGGLTSSVKELENYMIALMNGGDFNGETIIQKESIEKMWASHGKIEDSIYDYGNPAYGYGWRIHSDFFGNVLISHGGDFHICGGEVAMIPEKKIAVAIGLNTQPGPFAELVAIGILAVLLGKKIEDAIPLLSQIQKMQILIGKYRSYKGIVKAELLMQGGMHMIKAHLPRMLGGTITAPLIPKSMDALEFALPMFGAEIPVKVIKIDEKTKNVSILIDRYLLHKI